MTSASSSAATSRRSSRMVSMISRERGSNRHSSGGMRTSRIDSQSRRISKVRFSRRRKCACRTARRTTMKSSRRAMPAKETVMAAKMNRAGPSHFTQLETESIAQSRAGLRTSLRTVLAEHISGEVLTAGNIPAQAASPGPRGETPDLIGAGEILASHGKEYVATEAPHQGELQPGDPGRLPARRQSGEGAARRRDAGRPDPIAREVDQHARRQREHARRAEPQPALVVVELEAADERFSAESEPVVQLEEGFALGDHSIVVADRPSHRDRIARRRLEGDRAAEAGRLPAEADVISAGEVGGPARLPIRAQAGSKVPGGVGVVVTVNVGPEPEFVAGFFCQAVESFFGLGVPGFQPLRLAERCASLGAAPQGAKYATAADLHVGARRGDLRRAVQ